MTVLLGNSLRYSETNSFAQTMATGGDAEPGGGENSTVSGWVSEGYLVSSRAGTQAPGL